MSIFHVCISTILCRVPNLLKDTQYREIDVFHDYPCNEFTARSWWVSPLNKALYKNDNNQDVPGDAYIAKNLDDEYITLLKLKGCPIIQIPAVSTVNIHQASFKIVIDEDIQTFIQHNQESNYTQFMTRKAG